MREYVLHSEQTYTRRFGSWLAALEAAGFDPDRGPTDAELLAELRRLRDDLEKQPSAQDMSDHGAYGTTTYVRHFGSWSAALEEAFDGEGDRNGESG
ncbi:homing endonuclease associated repeat-containing protein [Halorubrum sp. FL23]|uniref:homing endonuclease associated repeat-containing protein n=1 Tax=Halorubrum sp. FL23 TaxID=3458704 RepID=UPI004034A60A